MLSATISPVRYFGKAAAVLRSGVFIALRTRVSDWFAQRKPFDEHFPAANERKNQILAITPKRIELEIFEFRKNRVNSCDYSAIVQACITPKR